MLQTMRRRSPFVRFLALFWAALQLASPGVSAIADGKLAAENASGPATHVEATTTSACPVVHSPDCGVCRYLSGAACLEQHSALGFRIVASTAEPTVTAGPRIGNALALPHGRAPPVI